MTGCLAEAAGMGLVLFGFATLITPDPPEDWWSRDWARFWQGGTDRGRNRRRNDAFGDWLVTLPPEIRAGVGANRRPDRTRGLAGDPPERTP